jgi:hypothetical protein
MLAFNKTQLTYLNISASDIYLPNGGVLTVNLYRLNTTFVNFFVNRFKSNTKPPSSVMPPIDNWLVNRGEIIFFVKPREMLKVMV